MNIRVLFFASLRDISGVSEQQLDVQAGTSIASLWQQISAGF
jgi:molybdopterin converting factor small subunit